MAKHAARCAWYALRGAILATLGLGAAYALSLALNGIAWQTGAGALAFLATILTVGVLVLRMDPWDAVEEPAAVIRIILTGVWALAGLVLAFASALIGIRP